MTRTYFTLYDYSRPTLSRNITAMETGDVRKIMSTDDDKQLKNKSSGVISNTDESIRTWCFQRDTVWEPETLL